MFTLIGCKISDEEGDDLNGKEAKACDIELRVVLEIMPEPLVLHF